MPSRYLGILLIATVVVLWVASSELIQTIFDDSSLSFESPLFLTFYSTSLFSVYLLGFLACPSWRAGERNVESGAEELLLPAVAEDDGAGRGNGAESSLLSNRPTVDNPVARGSSVQLHARLAARFAPLWLVANWAFNASLCRSCGTGTSVSNSTLLSASSSVFTFIFSIIFLGDAFSFTKMLCALLNLGGVALLVLNDGSSDDKGGTRMVAGDLMSVFSAACMAAYSVQLKRMLPSQQDEASAQVSMPMLFGFLGLTAGVICLPLFLGAVALHCKGWANLELLDELVQRPRVLEALTVNGLLGTVLSDLLWAQAVVLTSPLVANLGIGFTIPLAFSVDYVSAGALPLLALRHSQPRRQEALTASPTSSPSSAFRTGAASCEASAAPAR
jgi:solute carrier family 35 protein F5